MSTEQTESAKPAADEDAKLSAEDWGAYARQAFGVSAHAVVGALEGSRKTYFTRDEVQKAVDRHAKRPVEVDPHVAEQMGIEE